MRGADRGTEKNRRRRYLIDKPSQLSYLLDQVTVGLAAVIASVLALFFLVFVQLAEDRIYHSAWSDTLFWDLVLLLVLLLLLAVYRGVLRSHRIAGPAHRFERTEQGYVIRSAGPDRTYGTEDDFYLIHEREPATPLETQLKIIAV